MNDSFKSVELKLVDTAFEDPCLVSFPQGVPSQGKDEDLQLLIGQKGSGKRKKHMICTDVNGVTYKGMNYEEYSSSLNTCKYLIGVVEPGGSEMKLYPTDHIFVMKPQLISKHEIPKLSTMSYNERRSSLTEEFGSKKKKRAMHAAQSNIILTENISGATAVESAMNVTYENFETNSVLLSAADEALEQNRQKLLPKYDITATTPEKAYPFDDLLPSDILVSIRKFITEKQAHEDYVEALKLYISSNASYSGMYIVELCPQPSSADSDADKKMKKYKRHLERSAVFILLIKLYILITSQPFNRISKADLTAKLIAPECLYKFIADNFVSVKKIGGKGEYGASKQNLDKLLLYIIVLGLHLSNFRLDITSIAKDLKITIKAVSDLARELGCQFHKQSESRGGVQEEVTIVDLPVPLKFPAKKMKRGSL